MIIMDLKQSIIKTLAYFDIFDYPLTKEELFRYLYTEDMQVRDYTGFLDQLEQFNINNKDGFYFLPGREDNIVERQSKIKLIEKKMKIGYRGIKKLRWIPFLRAVFVCNTVASGSVDENSDIDLFIITNTKRLWLVRFFATVTLKLFGLRTSGRQVKDKICLSFYVAEDSLKYQTIFSTKLKELGYSFDIAENGLAALELYKKNQYDLIFMDCDMPVMDGFLSTDLIRAWEIKHNLSRCPIIIASQLITYEDIELYKDSGMDDCIPKPFSFDDLLDVFRVWLKKGD